MSLKKFRKILEVEKPRVAYVRGWWFFMDDGPLGHFYIKLRDGCFVAVTTSRAPVVTGRGIVDAAPAWSNWSVLQGLPYRCEVLKDQTDFVGKYIRFKKK